MKSVEEIIAENTDRDGNIDLDACSQAFTNVPPGIEVTSQDVLNVIDAHYAWAFEWLADLVFELLEQSQALPEGKDAEMAQMRKAARFNRLMLTYQLLVAKQTGLYVPGK